MAEQGLGGRWQVLVAAVVFLVLAEDTAGQRTQSCAVQRSVLAEDKVDVHCNCIQRLTQMSLSIAQLTINQTLCSQRGLELSWPDLETRVAPETLILSGANIFFAEHQPDRVWNSSIVKINFINSSFEFLPAYAFRGMGLLEEVKILGGSIGTIKTKAFSSLQQLKVIEIANTTVKIIESQAFTNLTSLEGLDIVHSRVGNIESEAVFLLRQNDEDLRRCPFVNRSDNILHDIMGRPLSSTRNLSLPEYGTRLLLFKNTIQTLKPRAITSETLGFLIVGGNHIENIHSRAFSMDLYNECEISAAIFVANKISNLGSSALAGLKGRNGVSYPTFIALSNNVFLSVAKEGFLLADNLTIFSIDENIFQCTCDGFDWILSNADSQNQRELEKEIVLKAICLDGSNLISFTSSCTDHGTTTIKPTPKPTRPTARPPTPVPVPQPSSAPAAHTVSFVGVTVSVLSLTLGRTLM